MRLLVATQAVDADDLHLAQTLDIVRALAGRCDEVVVLCDRVGRHDLPANVSFRTFGARRRAERGLRFQRALLATVRERRPEAILSHMVPLFVVLAAPVAKPLRIPLLLWYTHWHGGRLLRVADRLADAVLTVSQRSYPLSSGKVRAIGHAIDVARFEPRAAAPSSNGSIQVVALGRTEPRKGLLTVLGAVELAAERGVDVRVEIRGPQINDAERRHRVEIEERIRTSELLRARAMVADAVTRDRLPDVIRAADAVVSATRGETTGGALDKVVYESAACAVPVLACNPNFDDVLGGLGLRLIFRPGDAGDLADALAEFAASDADTRTAIGRELRRRAEERHSVDHWADGVLDAARDARRRYGAASGA